MSIGLFALLDDVAALIKVTAASLDDIPAQVAKTGAKVSGVVIDDAAVTPKYVVGLDPSRELSIIYNIAKKSMINKLLFLGPGTILFGYFAPWAITPILMCGGAYLCFEGYEKVHSIFAHHDDDDEDPTNDQPLVQMTPEELEKDRIDGAVTTDLILSAEIMAITYGTVADKDIMSQIIVMIFVAIGITVAVYGFVGLIVKADDLGLHMTKDKYHPAIRKTGRSIILFMPHFLMILGYVGTAAMLWVGAEIIAHGVPFLHHGLTAIHDKFIDIPVIAWFAKVIACVIGGLIVGGIVAQLLIPVHKIYNIFKTSKKES
jgi:predicted DNA repair protein MutK